MRAPNWTAGISVGLLIVAMIAVVRLSQNAPLKQDPRKAIEYYASQAAKKIYHDGDLVASADTPATSYGAPRPTVPTYGSSQLVGEPQYQMAPRCPICGGDSRFCAHSGRGAQLIMAKPEVSRLSATTVGTIFDRHMDNYFGR